jgi:hypothetical protein
VQERPPNHQALPAGARLLVIDQVLPPGNANVWSTLMDLNMFVLFGSGAQER